VCFVRKLCEQCEILDIFQWINGQLEVPAEVDGPIMKQLQVNLHKILCSCSFDSAVCKCCLCCAGDVLGVKWDVCVERNWQLNVHRNMPSSAHQLRCQDHIRIRSKSELHQRVFRNSLSQSKGNT